MYIRCYLYLFKIYNDDKPLSPLTGERHAEQIMLSGRSLERQETPDVMGTGYHAAICAGVVTGKTVAVVGDGAVGLCAVLSAKILGASRIILVGHNEARLKLGQKFGATDHVSSRQDTKAIEEVIEMTHGGAECVSECVGNRASFDVAIGMARPGVLSALSAFPT